MESPNSNYKNLASILLTNAGNSSDTTIVVDDTDAAIMPTAPFYATIMPTTELANITNSEIVYVTASSSSGGETTYTVSRGQRGTTAQSWDAGKAVMTQAVYTQDVQAQKQGYYNAELSSGSAFTITNASAPTTPVVGSRISVIFDTAISTASTVTIAINGGTAYNVAVSGVTFDSVGTLTTSLKIASGKLYDMIFDGTEWVIANTFGKVTSDNIDCATSEVDLTYNDNYVGVPGSTFVETFGKFVIAQINFSTKGNTTPPGAVLVSGLPIPASQANITGMVGGVSARFAVDNQGRLFLGGSSPSLPANSAAGFSFVYRAA